MVATGQNVRDLIRLKPVPGVPGVVIIMTGSGAPTDGLAGTGTRPQAARGSLYIDTVNGRTYINNGTGGQDNTWNFLDSTA